MPAGNGTGPSGFGPMTGRAAGYCAGYSVPGYANPIRGRGFYHYGRSRGGGGRGWRNIYYATGLPHWARGGLYPPAYGYGYAPPEMTKETEIKMLKDQAEFMQKEMSTIQDRIKELESMASEQNAR